MKSTINFLLQKLPVVYTLDFSISVHVLLLWENKKNKNFKNPHISHIYNQTIYQNIEISLKIPKKIFYEDDKTVLARQRRPPMAPTSKTVVWTG